MRAWIANQLTNKLKSLRDHIAKREETAKEAGHTEGRAVGRLEGHEAGRDQGQKTGLRAGHAAGYAVGRSEGHSAGYKEGHQQGLDKGKWVIEDRRTRAVMPPLDPSIYGPSRFSVTDRMEADMRGEVEKLAAQNLVARPTPSQWEMILADHPATCVAAGAGSGKSTTLALRVAFMLVHLGVSPEDVTMVTFTRHAARELRGKLLSVLRAWDYDRLDEKGAERLVRTFHSVLYGMAKFAFPGYKFFDVIKDEDSGNDEDAENPFSTAGLTDAQLDLLKEAHSQLYNSDKEFASHVAKIAQLVCERDVTARTVEEDVNDYIIKAIAERDEKLVRLTNDRWKEHGLLPIDGLEVGLFSAFKVKGRQFFANARVTASGTLVFFGDMSSNQELFRADDIFPVTGRPNPITVGQAIGNKRKVVARYYSTKNFYINNFKALNSLKLLISLNKIPVPVSVPDFELRLEGEISSAILPEAFYSQASFIESLGLEVTHAVQEISLRERGVEYYFCAALRIFWPYFERFLSNFDPKLMTFNRAFLLLSHDSKAARQALTSSHLRPFTHALIDEFQDISPQIASWLKACQRRLAITGRNPTIMAIGDDWQSIYGWRGSAPEFFIHFDEHFPVHKDVAPACHLEMVENFRSVRPIVEDAQKLLALVQNKVVKQVKAINVAASGEHGVLLRIVDMKKNLDLHAAFILSCLQKARKGEGRDKNLVIVLCRTNKTLNDLKDAIRNKTTRTPGLAFYTFHSAKGLQGETAIIFEDAEYASSHLLRNAIYAQAKTEQGERIFRQSYDQAMTDEAYRLAYVAVTRGMKRVFWFVDAQKHASKVFEPTKERAAPT